MEIEIDRITEIRHLHEQFIDSLKRSLDYGMKIGELLTEQKADLNHGQFGIWIDENLPFSRRTAQNYMKIFRERDQLKNATVSHLTEAYRVLEHTGEPDDKPNNLILYEARKTACMVVDKEISDNCPYAVMHPIKMDNILEPYTKDHDLDCKIIYEILANRDRMPIEDYMVYVPLRVSSSKAWNKHFEVLWRIEHERNFDNEEIKEMKAKAEKYMDYHNELGKRIGEILKRCRW